jgi:hypothetical protein
VTHFNFLRDGMIKLRARFKLNDFEVASYPHMKKNDRSKTSRMLKHLAMTDDERKRKVAKPADFDKIYGDIGSIDAVLKSKE